MSATSAPKMTTPPGFVRRPDVEQRLETRTGLKPGQVKALEPYPPNLIMCMEANERAMKLYDVQLSARKYQDLLEAVRVMCHCACRCAFMELSRLVVPVKDLLRLARDPLVSFDYRFSGLPSLVYVGVPALQAALHNHPNRDEWIECFKLVAARLPLGKDLKESIPQLTAYAAEKYRDFGISSSSGKTADPMINVLIDRVVELCGGDKEAAFKLLGVASKP